MILFNLVVKCFAVDVQKFCSLALVVTNILQNLFDHFFFMRFLQQFQV